MQHNDKFMKVWSYPDLSNPSASGNLVQSVKTPCPCYQCCSVTSCYEFHCNHYNWEISRSKSIATDLSIWQISYSSVWALYSMTLQVLPLPIARSAWYNITWSLCELLPNLCTNCISKRSSIPVLPNHMLLALHHSCSWIQVISYEVTKFTIKSL